MNNLLQEEAAVQEMIKPRKPVTAFLLSLLLPGLGQVYNGELLKGTLITVFRFGHPFLFGVSRAVTWFYGLVAVLVIELAIRLYSLYDAVKAAKKQQLYIPKPYNKWYYHLLIAILVFSAGWFYEANSILGVQSFNIPTPSSEPTLQLGDKLIVDLKAYTHTDPEHGDIVVFKRGEENFVYRIAGLPADTIDLIDNIVSINGKQSKITFVKELIEDDFVYNEFEEEFPNGQRHRIYRFKKPLDTTKSTQRNIIVPAGNYYLLGDNRDNALDSRYEGFVPKEKILGQVVYSYWGQSTDRINLDFRKQ